MSPSLRCRSSPATSPVGPSSGMRVLGPQANSGDLSSGSASPDVRVGPRRRMSIADAGPKGRCRGGGRSRLQGGEEEWDVAAGEQFVRDRAAGRVFALTPADREEIGRGLVDGVEDLFDGNADPEYEPAADAPGK